MGTTVFSLGRLAGGPIKGKVLLMPKLVRLEFVEEPVGLVAAVVCFANSFSGFLRDAVFVVNMGDLQLPAPGDNPVGELREFALPPEPVVVEPTVNEHFGLYEAERGE